MSGLRQAAVLTLSAFALTVKCAYATDTLFAITTSNEVLRKGQSTVVRVVGARGGQTLESPYQCRIIPAHTDVGLRVTAASGCEAELFIDAKTRLSRFALDPYMSVDVLVFANGERVAFLSTKVRYAK